MIKMIPTLLLKVSVLTVCLTTSPFTFATPNSISIEQVTEDVTYLASDDLKGRGNFSPIRSLSSIGCSKESGSIKTR